MPSQEDRAALGIGSCTLAQAEKELDHCQADRQHARDHRVQHAGDLQPGARHDEQPQPDALPQDHAARHAIRPGEAHVQKADEGQRRAGHREVKADEEQPARECSRQRRGDQQPDPCPTADRHQCAAQQHALMIGRPGGSRVVMRDVVHARHYSRAPGGFQAVPAHNFWYNYRKNRPFVLIERRAPIGACHEQAAKEWAQSRY